VSTTSPDAPGTELELRREAEQALGSPLPAMTDAEFAGLWRTAKGLAESQLFKDARQAGQAFAKILAGRDLGLTPFESMGQLHVIEGKVEASSDLHATRVRERGYDFRVAWLKIAEPAKAQQPPKVEAVWADEEDLADLRDTYGCAIEFRDRDGSVRGVSRWTLADSVTAGLLKDRGGHQRFPRSMYFARAMTNGVAWYVPEVMGGMRVYGAGEIARGLEDDLTVGENAAEIEAADLPTEAEAIIARAHELGHAGLQDRSVALMASQGGPETFKRWLRAATMTLNRLAKAREGSVDATAEVEPEPESAPVSTETADAPDATSDPVDGSESAESADEAPVSAEQRAADLREWADSLDALAEDEEDEARAAELREEAEHRRTEADALGDDAQADLFDQS
jgi:hypothetical protein